MRTRCYYSNDRFCSILGLLYSTGSALPRMWASLPMSSPVSSCFSSPPPTNTQPPPGRTAGRHRFAHSHCGPAVNRFLAISHNWQAWRTASTIVSTSSTPLRLCGPRTLMLAPRLLTKPLWHHNCAKWPSSAQATCELKHLCSLVFFHLGRWRYILVEQGWDCLARGGMSI